MKKKLLKPPEKNGEIFIRPNIKEIKNFIGRVNAIATAHQPYFFNPGVSLKFIFLDALPFRNKKIIFLDTDSVKLKVKIPSGNNKVKISGFINSDRVLFDYPSPDAGFLSSFFNALEDDIKSANFNKFSDIFSSLLRFKDIVLENANKKFLKELLSESFLRFYGINENFFFMSDFLKKAEFEDFFLKIYKDSDNFRMLFNQALEDYRNEFRFRYKNFPFPGLEHDELPFWIVKDGRRSRCFKKDMDILDFKNKKTLIFPRASTLTLFLRLYETELFIHGIGGANYEWVQDRIIEKFFKKNVIPYFVISGTFLMDGFKERDFPYFLFSPDKINQAAKLF